jgi:hypothetical protein
MEKSVTNLKPDQRPLRTTGPTNQGGWITQELTKQAAGPILDELTS